MLKRLYYRIKSQFFEKDHVQISELQRLWIICAPEKSELKDFGYSIKPKEQNPVFYPDSYHSKLSMDEFDSKV